MQREPSGGLTGKGEGLDLVEVLGLGGGQIDERRLVVERFLVIARFASLGASGSDRKGAEAAVFGKDDAGGTLVAEGGRGGGFTDRVAGLLGVFEVAQDDLAVAFIGGETVGEPNAVG